MFGWILFFITLWICIGTVHGINIALRGKPSNTYKTYILTFPLLLLSKLAEWLRK